MTVENMRFAPDASHLTGRLVERCELPPSLHGAMFGLLDEHFAGVSREQFAHDLREKNWAILLERPPGQLVGFSTLLVYETRAAGELATVVYSGDTIVRRDAWGSPALARTWIASVMRLRALYPRGTYYWLLITSGYRTYRFLPVFWRDFLPRHDRSPPPDQRHVLDALARERFGEGYDAEAGVVRFAHPQRLRDVAGIPSSRLDDPHVAFFARRNPGHADGDELVCLTELSLENLTPAGRRMAGL